MSNHLHVELGGTDKVILMEVRDDADNPVEAAGRFNLLLDAAEGKELAVGRIHYTDANTGLPLRTWGIYAPAEPDDDTPGSRTNDLWLGGGSGGGGTALPFALVSVQDDYLTVCSLAVSAASVATNQGGYGYAVDDVLTVAGGTGTAATLKVTSIGSGNTIAGLSVVSVGRYLTQPTSPNTVTGGTGTGAHVTLTFTTTTAYVAKEPRMRSSITSEVKFGVTHNYTYPTTRDSLNVVRRSVKASDQSVELQCITPVWLANETVYAIPAQTGLTGPSGAITLMLAHPRFWTQYPG